MATVRGLASTLASLNGYSTRLRVEVGQIVNTHVLRVHDLALQRAMPHRKSGSVVTTLTPVLITNESLVGQVIDRSPHAIYNEFGTGARGDASDHPPLPEGMSYRADWPGMAAIPFLTPAVEEDRSDFQDDLAAAIRRAKR